MGYEKTVVDVSTPEAVAAAIRKVNSTRGLRIQSGIKALWKVYNAPGHAISRLELESQFGALDLHFGWFCRRVAEELGANNPDSFALVDYTNDDDGNQVFNLKPAVVAAIRDSKAVKR